jgi:hypothetical protein
LTARLTTASGTPAFGQPTITGIQGRGFEQNLRLDPTNAERVYTSVPDALSSDTSWIWRSQDGGKTFKWIPNAQNTTGKATTCAGGGDTELAVDSTGSLYFADLTLANFSTARSDTQGATFTCSNTGVPDTAVDRQWYALDGDPKIGTPSGATANAIYLTNDEIGPGNVFCDVSGVGNNLLVMYRSPVPPGGPTTAGIEFGPANKITPPLSCDEGIMGNNEVSPVATTTGEILGTVQTTLPSPVRHVYVAHPDATFSKILIARCFPVAFGGPAVNTSDPSGLRCNDLPVANLGSPTAVRTGANFPSMAIDRTGNLYVVWEQGPVTGASQPVVCFPTALPSCGNVGNVSLYYAYSTNEGKTWSAPVAVPTPGLNNNVFPWIAAGDDGRIDIAWVGTPASVDPANPSCTSGPDSVNGFWSVYMTQSLNARKAKPMFTAPILVGEHPIHKGSIQTVLGAQCGDRALGDFFQLRIGSQGEAQIAYFDSNNRTGETHGMYARQIGGTGVYVKQTVSGNPIQVNSTSDVAGDGVFEADGAVSTNVPDLDIVGSSLTQPPAASCHPAGTACYRVTMTLARLTASPMPPVNDPDSQLIWLTQWLVPSDPASCTSGPAASTVSCTRGGRNFHVYARTPAGGGGGHCYFGQNALQRIAGGVGLTYPGEALAELTAAGACSFSPGTPGTITIDVPISQVSLDAGVAPYAPNRLFTVTASTMSAATPPEDVPYQSSTRLGGVLPNVIDVAPAYDAVPRPR